MTISTGVRHSESRNQRLPSDSDVLQVTTYTYAFEDTWFDVGNTWFDSTWFGLVPVWDPVFTVPRR